jgi:calcineurin-like phosphoesterase
MVGPRNSILGMKIETVIQNFRKQMKQKFELAEGPAVVGAVVVDVDDDTGRASSIERVKIAEE